MAEYNGWPNYETWCAKLWMDNDEGIYNYWLERTAHILSGNGTPNQYMTPAERRRYALVEALRKDLDEQLEAADLTTGVFSDLLGAAIAAIDWYKIADALIEDYEYDHPPVADEDEDGEPFEGADAAEYGEKAAS